jgi:hypothetical protein
MARKSAIDLVISKQIPVDPEGEQPTYIRSSRNVQTSTELIRYQQFIAEELAGKSYDSRSAVRQAFKEAAAKWSKQKE